MDRLGNVEAFVEAAEQGSFTRAAERLGITPSALSRRVAQLEAEVGIRLFNRTTRALRLSDEGREYFERVRGGGEGNYGVGVIPTRRWVLGRLRRSGFQLLASPRDLWLDYVRSKILRPGEISTGLKRRVARWVERHPGATDGRLTSWLWDVGMGSNFFIARRD